MDSDPRAPPALDSTEPSTPSNEREYDGINFRPKRAMASFENLVAMANYQEGPSVSCIVHENIVLNPIGFPALKEARKIIWRDKGQPVIELDTLKQCSEHALRGAMRSGGLAFSVRALVNLILALIRIGSVPRCFIFFCLRNVQGSFTAQEIPTSPHSSCALR